MLETGQMAPPRKVAAPDGWETAPKRPTDAPDGWETAPHCLQDAPDGWDRSPPRELSAHTPIEIRPLAPVPLASVSRVSLEPPITPEWHRADHSSPKKVELPINPIPPASEAGPLLSRPETAPEPQVKRDPIPPSAAMQAWIKKRIEDVCGTKAQGVDVIFLSGTTMVVRLHVRSKEDGIEVSKQVFKLSELVPCDISLEMKVLP